MAPNHIIAVRHGQTASNLDGKFQGHQDISLDAMGMMQAATTANALSTMLGNDAALGAVRVVSSDLQRASATAKVIADRLGVTFDTDAGLRERHFGQWEGLTRDQVQRQFPDEYARWVGGKDMHIGGGESGVQVWDRVEATMRKLIANTATGTLVVVSHGAAIRGILVRLMGLGDSAGRSFEIMQTAAWATLHHRADSWTLTNYNVRPQ